MTAIQIKPAYRDVKPEGFYVYFHRRATDRTIFNVGKGHANRAWRRASRNQKWINVSRKNGVLVDIVIDGLTEEEAFRLERISIKYLLAIGLDLCNFGMGGEGPAGRKASLEERVKNSRVRGGYAVSCSAGKTFDTIGLAVDWLQSIGHEKAHSINIIKCIKGNRKSAYGMAWWKDGEDKVEYVHRNISFSKSRSKIIIMDESTCFRGLASAGLHVRPSDTSNNPGRYISLACRGKIDFAYGHSWRFQ